MSSRKKLHVEIVIDFTINKVVKVFVETDWPTCAALTFADRYRVKNNLNPGDVGIIKKSVEGAVHSFIINTTGTEFYKVYK